MTLQVDRDTGVPIGTQLAWALSERISGGALRPGDKLPSVRDLALEAGVNVNTARAVYARLEREGLIRSEQGRGTFVASRDDPDRASDVALRRDLRRRIAMLEAELVRRPQLPAEAAVTGEGATGRLPTTEELSQIHDDLLGRVRRLDEDRDEIVRLLQELRTAAPTVEEPAAAPSTKRSSSSLKGARVRWVGA